MKRLVCLIISACMLLGMFTVVAAEDFASVSVLYVGGVDALTTPEGEGWSFDAASGVLTLTDCTLTSSYSYTNEWGDFVDATVFFVGALTIELEGDNFIERSITTAPSNYTQYAAIWAQDVDGVLESSTLSIRGSGSLTAGVLFPEEAYEWDNLGYSVGIMCLAEGGVDLTGLCDGGYLDVYGGMKDIESPWKANAFNTSPTFGDNSIVVAYRDAEGTVENEYGYNWNNNDAWRMKVLTVPAYLGTDGTLTLASIGTVFGKGWSWENGVLSIGGDTDVTAIRFKPGIDGAQMVLTDDLTLDSTSLGYVDAIQTYSDLTVDANGYVFTAISNNYVIYAECADITLTGGEFILGDEHDSETYVVYVQGGDIVFKDMLLTSESGALYTANAYDEEYNKIPAGDILIEDSDIVASYIYDEGSLRATSSILYFTGGWDAIYAEGDVEMSNSRLTALLQPGCGIYSGGRMSIDNCELSISVDRQAIVAYNYDDAEGETLTFTNMTVTTPNAYSIGIVEDNYGGTFYSVFDGDGVATSSLWTLPIISDEPELGDGNGDGVVNIIDMTISAQYIAQRGLTGSFDLSDCDFAAMDINGDGVLDQLDLTAIGLMIFNS